MIAYSCMDNILPGVCFRPRSMRESQDSNHSSQHTSTITCTAVVRVWHFNAFHLTVSWTPKEVFKNFLACFV